MAEESKGKGEMARRRQRGMVPSDIDQWFDQFFGRGWLPPALWERSPLAEAAGLQERAPRIDVSDRENEIVVRAEVPGVKKDDLDVSVNEDSVTIRGETRYEEKKEQENFYRREIGQSAFARTVALPGQVDPNKAKAKFQEGVLELTLPKSEGTRRRKITVE